MSLKLSQIFHDVAAARSYVAMLLRSLDVTCLTALEICVWPLYCVVGHAPIYLAARHTLSDLTLVMSPPPGDSCRQLQQEDSQFWSQLGLSLCHAVRTVRFALAFITLGPDSDVQRASLWRHIVAILSTIPASSLSQITFQGRLLDLPASTTMDFPWESFESTLLERSRDASQVLFDIQQSVRSEAKASFEQAILQNLPRIRKKHTVLFEYSCSH